MSTGLGDAKVNIENSKAFMTEREKASPPTFNDDQQRCDVIGLYSLGCGLIDDVRIYNRAVRP
jgi:hypothetical protein